MFILTACCCS